ncbi:MAG: UbiH/UbiF/VisC/COQ6 family ubiquinone biosynthesis hydroxylase [Porticoccaceae bacterium]|jgi:2-octaprenylphenol hydroxylase|nr:UbiH/UbiF/VisC/COQ6 family ubiquinone biosynthesis hydroxylase [Porticoccaceae bacterium]HLS99044.1 UbiH/UbiF/VisC/COQ6 family ubiquinone biosynthesis hydroxylase [Porticoccaceae bacterium]
MNGPEQHDVLIAGGGLVGAALAVMLGRHPAARDLRIAVVETRPFSADLRGELFDTRVIALAESSRHLLADAGVWTDELAARACPYRRMVVRDSAGTGCIEFDCAEVHRPDLGHIVENAALLGPLHGAIEGLDNARFVYGAIDDVVRDGDDRLVLRLADGRELGAPLVVAADGAQSLVRERCGFALRSWDYGHSAIVATVRGARPHDFVARQWFTPEGPLAFLPLRTADGDCRHVSIVWSQDHDEATRLMALDDGSFCRELGHASEHCLGDISFASRRFAFPLRQRHAVDYVQPGVVLVGDAAHTIHPLAGQGVNLGFADAAALVEELGRALERGLPVGHLSALERYQRRRKPANLAMMAAMEGFKRLFDETPPLVRLVRNNGMNLLNRLAPVKNQLIRQAMGF